MARVSIRPPPADELLRRTAMPPACRDVRDKNLRIGGAINIEQRIENAGHNLMPFAAGLHPYFHVRDAEKADVEIETSAEHAWDNVGKQEFSLSGDIDLTLPEVDLHLHDHDSATARMKWALQRSRELTRPCSSEMVHPCFSKGPSRRCTKHRPSMGTRPTNMSAFTASGSWR